MLEWQAEWSIFLSLYSGFIFLKKQFKNDQVLEWDGDIKERIQTSTLFSGVHATKKNKKLE